MPETCNRWGCAGERMEYTAKPINGTDGVFHDDGVDKITDVVVPGKSSLKHAAKAQVAIENENYKEAAKEYGYALIDAPPAAKGVNKIIGGDGVKEAAKGAVKDQLSPTGMAKGEAAKAGVNAAFGNNDSNTAKMLTPELNDNDIPLSGGNSQSDDGSKSFWEDPWGWIKRKLGWDKDDNQSDNQLAQNTPNAEKNGESQNNEEPNHLDGQDDSISGSGDSASGQGDGAEDQPPTGSMCPILNTSNGVAVVFNHNTACNDAYLFQAA